MARWRWLTKERILPLNKLQTLVRALEKEKAALRKLIDNAVTEGEYLMAHFHSEALSKIDAKLHTLRSVEDKDYNQKKLLRTWIRQAEKRADADDPEGPNCYFEKKLERLRQELQALNQRENVVRPESVLLSGYLDSFVSGEIKGLNIILQKSTGFAIKISRDRLGIKMIIPNLKALRQGHSYYERSLRRFSGLGFILDQGERRLTTVICKPDKQQLLLELKTIISKIVFEIFYFQEFDGDSYIEIRS